MNEQIKNALNNDKVKDAINGLNNEQKNKLNKLLSDEKELEKILNTPQAQMLLKKLMEK